MMRRNSALIVLVGAALVLSGCRAKKQSAPQPSGPSELGTSLAMSANPDTLRQDGASQSQIAIQARDASGQPLRNLPLRLDIVIGGAIADYGQISAKNIVTGSDGRATAVYTSPEPPVDSVDNGTTVQILATPVGTDAANAVARSVSIRLVPPGVILPPNGAPKAAFVFSPSAPLAQSDVTFDASSSSDADGQIVSYAWNFGDGSTGSGQVARHQFAVAGSYTVSLRVTDDRGMTGTVTSTLTVAVNTLPIAAFVFSPTDPIANQEIFFNASASKAGTGRRIVGYDWDFGTGRTGSGVTISKTYGTPATYKVTLVVTDDIGQKSLGFSQDVTVTGGDLTADYVYSPKAPTTADTVRFDASASSAGQGRRIVSYEWNFGDGATASGINVSHRFNRGASLGVGDWTVTLVVTDDLGQRAVKSVTVTVTAP